MNRREPAVILAEIEAAMRSHRVNPDPAERVRVAELQREHFEAVHPERMFWTTERPASNVRCLFACASDRGGYGLGLTHRNDPSVGRATRWAELPAPEDPGWRDPAEDPPVRGEMFLYRQEDPRHVGLAYWTISGFPSDAYAGGNIAPLVYRWHELPGIPRQ